MSELIQQAEDMLDAWEDGEQPKPEVIAGLSEVIRSDDDLKERYDNLVEFDRMMDFDQSFEDQAARVAVAVTNANAAPPPPVPVKKDRTMEWLALVAMVAVAVIIWVIPSQNSSAPPMMHLEVSGGEQDVLGPDDPKTEIKFSSATGMQLVLRPERESKLVPEVKASLEYNGKEEELKIEWEYAPSGSMRFKGQIPTPAITIATEATLHVNVDYACAEDTCKQALEQKVTLLPSP